MIVSNLHFPVSHSKCSRRQTATATNLLRFRILGETINHTDENLLRAKPYDTMRFKERISDHLSRREIHHGLRQQPLSSCQRSSVMKRKNPFARETVSQPRPKQ